MRKVTSVYLLLLFVIFISNLIISQPQSLRSDIKIRELGTVGDNSVRIVKNPVDKNLYILENNGNIIRVDFDQDSSASFATVYTKVDHGIPEPLGIAFGSDGTIFLVGNIKDGSLGTATVMKGVPVSSGSSTRTWNIIARTVPYDYGVTYNHRMSGIAVDPGQAYVYVNSGARTDHGELRNGQREAGLTSIILRLPVDGNNIELQDDREWLRSNGYLFAEGIRNDFTLAFSAAGELFSVENSGDRDDSEEMNWLREGHHYGFPWVIGGNRTPQQDTPYVPTEDPLLSPFAWGGGNLYETFSNDPDYPDAPDGVVFTDAVRNFGPDADKFRNTANGEVLDASDLDTSITTFSTHRSPNGLVFDKDSVLAGELSGGAFVISLANGNLLRAMGDNGEDLLHLSLTRSGDNYHAAVHRIISGFRSPLGIEISANKLFVLETGLWNNSVVPKLYEITLPSKTAVGFSEKGIDVNKFHLGQNYPNPFNPTTNIKYTIAEEGNVKLSIYSILGEEIKELVNDFRKAGTHIITWDGKNSYGNRVANGIYLYRINSGSYSETKRMILLK